MTGRISPKLPDPVQPGRRAILRPPCSDSRKTLPMFPEYRELITSLKTTDLHFTRLFDQHNELDQKIQNMEDGIEMATPVEIDTLKREKLQLKDELYVILKKAESV